MGWQIKLGLMNLAVAAALFYRWRTGTSLTTVIILGVVMFALVNGLILLTRKKNSTRV